MHSTLHCIALRTTRFDDRRNLLTVWSRESGRLTLSMPAGAGAEARRRRAMTMPLGLFECQCDVGAPGEVHPVRDMRPWRVLASLATEPRKGMVAMLIAEVLERILRTAAPDETLSRWLLEAITLLDATESRAATGHYAIVFLASLSHCLGIGPDAEGSGRFFCLDDGRWHPSPPLAGRWLEAGPSRLARVLSRVPLSHAGLLRLDQATRRRALETILDYYTLHGYGLRGLKVLGML